MRRVVVIDYGSGNLRSAAKALERAGRDGGRECTVEVSDSAKAIAAADCLVLPGVGAFADCWRGLNALPGAVEALRAAVLERGRPFLGICVGMQLMATRGREYEICPGLDWISGEVVAIARDDPHLKVPHMGWNELHVRAGDHPVLKGIETGDHAYFVHSFGFRAQSPADVLAVTDYGGTVTAVIGRDNMVGTQFHPEKSQAAGLRLLANFLGWSP